MSFLEKLLQHEEIKSIQKNAVKTVATFITILLFISISTWYSEMSNNKRRVLLGIEPLASIGIITYNKTSGRGAYYANYKFKVTDKEFKGQTFDYYSGNVGDSVKVLYNERFPVNNILASEAVKMNVGEKVKKNILITTFLLLGVGLLFLTKTALSVRNDNP